jgi:multiple sugar transport system substrate-binding protein
MWASGEEETAALKSQVEIAREQNPGIEIELRTSPWADYFTKLTTDMASGNAACVVGMNSSMFAGYATGFRKLSAEDLQSAEVDPADFAEGATDLMSLGGDLYGLPTDISTMVIYTNEDLLGAAGVTAPADGWDYDEFHEAAATATSGDKSGFIVGVSANSWMALPISVSGAQPVTEDGELDLDGDEFVDAATAYAELVTDEQISPEFPSAAETNFAQDQFLAGNAGMVVDGTWNALRYLDNDSGFAAGLAPLPGRDSEEGLGMALGSGYGISESCEQPDAALKVLGSLLSEEAADDIASSGRAYPARTASQPLYLEALPEEHREKIQATFDAAFAHVEGQRVTEDWPKIGAYMLPNLIEVYSGRMTMADLLASAQSQFGG